MVQDLQQVMYVPSVGLTTGLQMYSYRPHKCGHGIGLTICI